MPDTATQTAGHLIGHELETISGVDPTSIPKEILESEEPLLLKGLVEDWPAVAEARQSNTNAMDYLRRFDNGSTVGVFYAAPEVQGRFFYSDDYSGYNYQRAVVPLLAFLAKLAEHAEDPDPPALYVGSTTVDACLPGFRTQNDLSFGSLDPLASIWIGNRTRIAAHYDVPNNIACVVAGRRRFTLFPPSALRDLYVGSLERTPAGQPISMVDFHRPDHSKFPRFSNACAVARVAELAAGDAIFIPSMWWHHVESLESLGILINYWWRRSPEHMGSPTDALSLALMSIRDLPDCERLAWQELFRYYVFEADDAVTAHIPDALRGALGPMDEDTSRRLRTQLLNRLNR